MKVRMKVDVSGNRDGQSWPPRGGVIDLPDEEGVQLCSNGMAVPVSSKDEGVETAVLSKSDVEVRQTPLTTESAAAVMPGPAGSGKKETAPGSSAATEKPAPRRPGRPKKTTEPTPTEKK